MTDFVHVGSPYDSEELSDEEISSPNMPPQRKKTKVDYLGFLDAHPFVRETVVDRIYGCIIGSALGDTIGLYTEFMPKHECERIYKDRKFQLVEPATELYADGHRSEHFQLHAVFPTSSQPASNLDTL
jgi:hypothetical protein